ncbi:MAG TPA: M90 family metallopeptidase [Burkholderiaceae bacterium]|nr:M90 family metallopeptidase [Burkholderiaceae bacterium]
MGMLIVAVLALLGLAWVVSAPWRIERLRARIAARPFPAAWRRILRERVPLVARLPVDLQQRLKSSIQVFLAEKPFIGCAGLEVTDEMRVVVAAQACLLELHDRPRWFPGLRQILVYPSAFVVERTHALGGGVLQDRREALSGESWSRGQVVLSWDDALAGAADPDDGRNVVIHEFAHQLDQQKGYASGVPLLRGRRRYRRWSTVFEQAWQSLRADLDAGRPTLLGEYAATEPAEFFAVASEVFFEQPHRMAADAPQVWHELLSFYRIDPTQWHPG